jgi:NAD-dependent dihydropyrimidine dehydrogenase PreA subunit
VNYSRWSKNRSQEWWRKYHCGVCEEHCPGRDDEGRKAILLKWSDIPKDFDPDSAPLPYVNSRACIGCGQCEKVCPVEGNAAIRVHGTNERGVPPWADSLLKARQSSHEKELR